MGRPQIGQQGLCRPVPDEAWSRYSARPVRTLDELQMVAAIRAAVFMSEQACPYGRSMMATIFAPRTSSCSTGRSLSAR